MNAGQTEYLGGVLRRIGLRKTRDPRSARWLAKVQTNMVFFKLQSMPEVLSGLPAGCLRISFAEFRSDERGLYRACIVKCNSPELARGMDRAALSITGRMDLQAQVTRALSIAMPLRFEHKEGLRGGYELPLQPGDF